MFKMTGKEEVLIFEGFEFKYILKNRFLDTNHIIIVFSGYGNNSDFNYDFLESLKKSRAYVLWIKDDFFHNEKATYYIDPIVTEDNKLEKAIMNFIEGLLYYLNLDYKDCTLLGCSKGGSSAIFYGIKYGFTNIVLSVPTLLIGSSIAGIIPKNVVRRNAKFILGDELESKNISKLDSLIVNIIKNDSNCERNIYLISSEADPKFSGQVKPFLFLFLKYSNFNFVESKSPLVRTHSDVTLHNAPLILNILGCISFNIPPIFNTSIIYGDPLYKTAIVDKKPILEIRKLEIDSHGLFHSEGVFFLRGLPCAEYSDFKYTLHLKSTRYNYSITLSKGNNKAITKRYYYDAFVNYDKAYFCTPKHNGLDISHINTGIYSLFIEITMHTGEALELPLYCNNIVTTEYIDERYSQSVFSERGTTFFSKIEINDISKI